MRVAISELGGVTLPSEPASTEPSPERTPSTESTPATRARPWASASPFGPATQRFGLVKVGGFRICGFSGWCCLARPPSPPPLLPPSPTPRPAVCTGGGKGPGCEEDKSLQGNTSQKPPTCTNPNRGCGGTVLHINHIFRDAGHDCGGCGGASSLCLDTPCQWQQTKKANETTPLRQARPLRLQVARLQPKEQFLADDPRVESYSPKWNPSHPPCETQFHATGCPVWPIPRRHAASNPRREGGFGDWCRNRAQPSEPPQHNLGKIHGQKGETSCSRLKGFRVPAHAYGSFQL